MHRGRNHGKKRSMKGEKMNKEKLIEVGLNEEQANNVIKVFKETIDGQYIAKHRFDEVNGDLKNVKEQLIDRDKQISELKAFEGTSKDLSEKIATLEKENKEKNDKYLTDLASERKRMAVKVALLEDDVAKPFDTDMVMSLFNLDNIEVDETGKINKGFKEQAETIKKDKSFLFNAKTEPGKPAGWKPAGITPADGDKGGQASDPSVSFGKSLAQVKLGMLGLQAKEVEKTTN